MRKSRTTLEVIAPTIEEAVIKGLDELGLPQDAVDVEILDEGSKGLFGLGSRQARVRLTVKTTSPGEEAGEEKPARAKRAAKRTPQKVSEVQEDVLPSEMEAGEEDESTTAIKAEPQDDYILQIAEAVVAELLHRMRVRADVSAEFGEADDRSHRVPVLVNITGQDLSILIGRQTETLNALQYIAGLIVSKETGRPLTLIIDVQGYRKRREQQLRQLARRMADQAVKTGRRQVLEPMPANERRIIHIELREYHEVSTESIGEEPRRKVTILLK